VRERWELSSAMSAERNKGEPSCVAGLLVKGKGSDKMVRPHLGLLRCVIAGANYRLATLWYGRRCGDGIFRKAWTVRVEWAVCCGCGWAVGLLRGCTL